MVGGRTRLFLIGAVVLALASALACTREVEVVKEVQVEVIKEVPVEVMVDREVVKT